MDTKKLSKYEWMYNYGVIYHNPDCHRALKSRERIVVYFILKALHQEKELTKKMLFDSASKLYNDYVNTKVDGLKKEQLSASQIRKDKKTYWLYRKSTKPGKLQRNYLTQHLCSQIAEKLIPLYLNIRTKSREMSQVHILSLNKQGEQLYNEWSDIIGWDKD